MIHTHKELLRVVAHQLFNTEKPQINSRDFSAILNEAKSQTVFSTVFPFFRDALQKDHPQEYLKYQELFLGNIIVNTNNLVEHDELHRLMTENCIPYCILKGIASAYYYANPALREMGDVDFLVAEEDFERTKQAVLGAGFAVDHGDDADSIHTAYKRLPNSILEQHRSVNGIPDGEVGERIKAELGRTIETSVSITLDGAACRIPDDFHHGLVMLLHVVSHMTSEGIGLRHLCDWAVFVNKLGSGKFKSLFEEKLGSFGLWRFAQILTMVCERHLGIAQMDWAQCESVTDGQLDAVMEDILNGGNFGKKDMNRYREIKYISNRGTRTVDDKNIVSQVFATLNRKTYTDHPWTERHKLLLPAGWMLEGGRYIGLLASGKRKSKGTSSMLKEASKRKDIYSKMKLFEI